MKWSEKAAASRKSTARPVLREQKFLNIEPSESLGNAMDTYRLFVAIRPSSDIVEKLTQLQIGVPDAKWSGPEKFHITLGFFGDLTGEQAELLDQQLATIRQGSFDVILAGAGHYGRAEPHSIWIGAEDNPDLDKLAKTIRRTARDCRIEMDKREFRPHVTLAYLRAFPDVLAVAEWEQRHNSFRSEPFWVDQFFLYSSRRRQGGSNIYNIEASYPLIG